MAGMATLGFHPGMVGGEGMEGNRPAATFLESARASGEVLQQRCGPGSGEGELCGGGGGSARVAPGADAGDERKRPLPYIFLKHMQGMV